MNAVLSEVARKAYQKYETFSEVDIRDIEALIIAAGKTKDMELKRIFTMFLWMQRDLHVPIQFWRTPAQLKRVYNQEGRKVLKKFDRD
jgi:hypothetical protein